MARHLEESSLRLYRTLEAVGLSEEMKRFHRQNVTGEIIATAGMSLASIDIEVYQFGSSSEGTTTANMGSDIDLVHCLASLPIVTDARDAVGPECLLMIWDDPTFNGYVKLQRVKNGVPITRHQISSADNDWEYDGSGRMCRKHMPFYNFLTKHGPAAELPVPDLDIPIDVVYALKCFNVPDDATLWLRRQHKSGWPSRTCVDRMSALPHFVVGVGHPFSRERDIEWRISSSLHERELMFSLNTVQHQCYGFMKMVKKNIIEPAVGEECISSYHCKTVLFWAIENTPTELWLPNNTIQCIFTCFLYLKYFQFLNNCPNFFGPASNLFEREVFERKKDRITEVINWILGNFREMITQITCSNVGYIYMSGRVPRHINAAIVNQKYHCNLRLIARIQLVNKQISDFVHGCGSILGSIDKLYDLLNVYSHVRNITVHTEEQTEEARQYLLPCIHFRIATCLAGEAFRLNRGPLRYSHLRRSLYHVNESRGRDLMTSRLIHVSILYKLQLFEQCEIILQQIDNDLKPHVYSLCRCYLLRFTIDANVFQWQELENVTARSMLKYGAAICLSFLPCEINVVHAPLVYEVGRSRDYPKLKAADFLGHNVSYWTCVDGKVYFYYMKYLVYTQLNKHVLAATARDKIQSVINTDLNLAHKDMAYNIMAWIYIQEHNHKDAIRYLRLSFEEQPRDSEGFQRFCSQLSQLE